MVETMDNEKAIDYMKGIHDALPHAAMQLLARASRKRQEPEIRYN